MAWWAKLFKRNADASLQGQIYRVAFTLYSVDGKRAAEVRSFQNGETYLAERDWVEGTTFKGPRSRIGTPAEWSGRSLLPRRQRSSS
jgi:hypothetical protein